MSQITRCPSCATSFKVVADQLRISEGWVRCGQCKEVFDASANLLPVAPATLLPDVSLTDARPPPAPIVRKSDAARAWGGGSELRSTPAPDGVAEAARGGVDTAHSAATGDLGALRAGAVLPMAAPSVASAMPVLDIPAPTVPAFLAAGGSTAGENALDLAPAALFSWRPAPGSEPPEATTAPNPSLLKPEVAASLADAVESPTEDAAERLSVEDVASPDLELGDEVGQAVDVLRGGYELPAAELPDTAMLGDLIPPGESLGGNSVAENSKAPVDVAEPSFAPEPALASSLGGPADPLGVVPIATPAAATEEIPEALPSVDFVQLPAGDAPLDLVPEDSSTAVLRARGRKSISGQADEDAEDDGAGHDAGPEVSFVVAARRKAFWRKPAVRAALLAVLLVLIFGGLLQVAVQERDRIAAMDPRARPWLLLLCEPLQCELAPLRQIADVVIDSSSFTKARGDSYQLALSMKSKADISLAMPAVELTLTDAQDQPVLRRVLLPTDMAAPAELPARGEWSTSVSVIVTTGGARVAGYRLLAFYP